MVQCEFVNNVQSSGSVENLRLAPSISMPIKATFYSFGIVALIPWNTLVLALPYLLDRLDGSPLQDNLPSLTAMTFTVSGLLAAGIATWLADKLRPTFSITFSIVFLTIALLALQIILLCPIPPTALLVSVLAGSFFLACSNSLFRTHAVAVAIEFGSEAAASYFSGTALVAVVISSGVFLAAYLADSETQGRTGIFLSFSLSIVVSLSSLAAYHSSIKHTQTFKEKFGSSHMARTDSEHDRLLQTPSARAPSQDEGIWATTGRNWGYNLAQCLIFTVELAVYPAVTAHVVPTHLPWTPLLFSTFHFLVFNLGDLSGRILVSTRKSAASAYLFCTCSVLQALLAPLFLLCNVRSPGTIGDVGFLVLVFMFALITGYTSSLGFVAVGTRKGVSARSGARVLQLWMLTGNALGSLLGIWIERWV